jgi:ankyrin repeat protein
MSDRELPARPNLEQYKKQARDLVRECGFGLSDALARVRKHHPRFHALQEAGFDGSQLTRTDAQLVLAREHGFESWPRFAKHIEMVHLIRSVAELKDPVAAFLEVACVPRHGWHGSGTLEHAEMILVRYPEVVAANIFTAAVRGDEASVCRLLERDTMLATAKGGPHAWDVLTYLCFSRYLRLDQARSEAFVRTARALLDAGASAKTGWVEMIDHPNPRPTFESALYGAAGVAQNTELTRLLMERGAYPNDEEVPYHVAETYDNTTMKIIVESGALNDVSLTTMLLRKADWHDYEGMKYLLERGADPNRMTHWKQNTLHQSLRRDNGIDMVDLLLDCGGDPAIENLRDGRTAASMAVWRGRGDVLRSLERRGIAVALTDVERLIAACAKGDGAAVRAFKEDELVRQVIAEGGTLLAEFAGNGNTEGVELLLGLGVNVMALYGGDPYFEIPKDSTALHVAAWRARHTTVAFLLENGAAVDVPDGKGRTPLALAVRACVDSHWMGQRTPESVRLLLEAGASIGGIDFPCGYDEVDGLLREHRADVDS